MKTLLMTISLTLATVSFAKESKDFGFVAERQLARIEAHQQASAPVINQKDKQDKCTMDKANCQHNEDLQQCC